MQYPAVCFKADEMTLWHYYSTIFPCWELVLHYVSNIWHIVFVSFSWDESSSISSGLSDGSDNLSSEEFNTSPTLNSLPTTPIGSRRNSAIVVSETHVSVYTTYTLTHTAVWHRRIGVTVTVVLIKLSIQRGIDEVLYDVSYTQSHKYTQQAAGHWHQSWTLIKYATHSCNIYHMCNDQCWLHAHTHCMLHCSTRLSNFFLWQQI